VQAFVNVDSEFRRADGHVVRMHDGRWEGQKWEHATISVTGRCHELSEIEAAIDRGKVELESIRKEARRKFKEKNGSSSTAARRKSIKP
jgi:hypothetical protein